MRKWFLPAATLTLTFLLSACALFSNHDMAEKFTVHNVYGDHMVLQRDMPVRIGGTAAPGKSVKVTIGENSVIPPNVQIGLNTAISGPTESEDYPNGILASGETLIKAGDRS